MIMEALFLNSSSFAPSRLARVSDKCDQSFRLSRKKSTLVHCQGGGNAIKTSSNSSSGFSSILTTRKDLDKGNLVLSPNGKSQAENNIAVKDLVPFGGSQSQSTSSVEMHDGIGILHFLRGKSFFVTGATGFLAKGTFDSFFTHFCVFFVEDNLRVFSFFLVLEHMQFLLKRC